MADSIGGMLVDEFEGEMFINGAWLAVCSDVNRAKCHSRLDEIANGYGGRTRLVTHKRKVIWTNHAQVRMTTKPMSADTMVERLERKIASKGAWMTSDLRQFYSELKDLIERLEAEKRLCVESLAAIRGMLSRYAGQPNRMGDIFKIADATLGENAWNVAKRDGAPPQGRDKCGCPYEPTDPRFAAWCDGYQAALCWMKETIR